MIFGHKYWWVDAFRSASIIPGTLERHSNCHITNIAVGRFKALECNWRKFHPAKITVNGEFTGCECQLKTIPQNGCVPFAVTASTCYFLNRKNRRNRSRRIPENPFISSWSPFLQLGKEYTQQLFSKYPLEEIFSRKQRNLRVNNTTTIPCSV